MAQLRGSGDERQFSMSGRRGGGRRSRAIRGGDGISQLPWQEVVNTYSPMQLLDEDRLEALIANSMRILSKSYPRHERKGDGAVREAGAIVDPREPDDPHRRIHRRGGARHDGRLPSR